MYYEQFFRTALAGIDRSQIMPTTIQIGQVILLISFLVAVYESYIRGGDVRMLGTAGVKYVTLGLVLSVYATAFSYEISWRLWNRCPHLQLSQSRRV